MSGGSGYRGQGTGGLSGSAGGRRADTVAVR